MNEWIRAWFGLDWNDPRVIGVVLVIALLALVRRWSLVLLLVLVVALGQGLEYLLGQTSLGAEFSRGAIIGVYVFGGLLLLFLGIAHLFTKD